jgi:arylsulfatase A-like enzyme
LDAVPRNQPFFLFYAPPAMHTEATPNPSGIDANSFLSYAYRGRGYGETDLSDKPGWVTDPGRNRAVKVQETDAFHQDQLRTLRDTDRTVGEILAKLTQKGLDQDTVVIFTSDNGYMWGEHGLYQKGNAYEESVGVPMIIRAPGTTPRTESRIVAVNLDVPATILAQAGATIDGGRTSEGMNLTPLINNTPTTWRTELFLEGYGGIGDGSYGTWAAIISGPWKYITQRSGGEELYNRTTDPFELENRAQDPTLAARKSQFAASVNAQKGLTVRKPMFSQPVGRVGQAYSFNPDVWGGTSPHRYTVRSGNLPLGLRLDPATGDISGVPTLAGAATFELQVTDSSQSPFTGNPQRWIEKYTITVR